eukprot:m51a1_g12026 hypothetical protein (267) ;mRNA; f:323-19557
MNVLLPGLLPGKEKQQSRWLLLLRASETPEAPEAPEEEKYQEEQQDDQDDINWDDMTTLVSMGPADNGAPEAPASEQEQQEQQEQDDQDINWDNVEHLQQMASEDVWAVDDVNSSMPRLDPRTIWQDGWRWCSKCQALCFSETPGKCIATGADHDYTGSANYRLSTKPNTETQQAGWRWCSKCGCLWYADWTFKGTCAAGGSHDSTGSSAYSVTRGVVPSGFQEGWRWCSKCFMLHYGANTGYCPAAGPHTAERSLNYAVEFSPAY